jgi:hypothetical protein
LFDEILARELGDFRFGRLHRLAVDAYSLQNGRSTWNAWSAYHDLAREWIERARAPACCYR